MIELSRTQEIHAEWKVKVIGIGSAGSNAVDRLNREGVAGVELLVANTDARALAAAFTQERFILGQGLTRGMGAGGDPELGRAAALESISQVGARLAGASLVVLLVGLGGGTGSGAAPCIARMAREQGAHVAVFATLPFAFEGRRRREQALEAVDALREQADLVVCFENDRMPALSDPSSGIEDAFQAVDSLLAQAVRAVCAMTRRRSVLNSGLDEIAAVVAGMRSTALFGYGAADGEERARAAVARAFDNPLLDGQGAFRALDRLWVYLSGGADLRFSELQAAMEAIVERVGSEVRVYFGVAVDSQMSGAVAVTLLAGVPGGGEPASGVATASSAALDSGRLATSSSSAFSSVSAGPAAAAPVMAQVSEPSVFEGRWSASTGVEPAVETSSFAPEAFGGDRHSGAEVSSQGYYRDPEFQAPSAVFTGEVRAQESSTSWEQGVATEPVSSGEWFSGPVPSAQSHVEPAPVARDSRTSEFFEEGVVGSMQRAGGGELAASEAYSQQASPAAAGEEDRFFNEVAREEPVASAPAVARSVPVPPYELAKERERLREEAAAAAVQGVEAAREEGSRESGRDASREREVRPIRDGGVVAGGGVAAEDDQLIGETQASVVESNVRRSKDTVQEQMSFEPVSRGRFEKTDRTIVDGEDLDVPTFMRQGVQLD